jgi:hypothetical protein
MGHHKLVPGMQTPKRTRGFLDVMRLDNRIGSIAPA